MNCHEQVMQIKKQERKQRKEGGGGLRGGASAFLLECFVLFTQERMRVQRGRHYHAKKFGRSIAHAMATSSCLLKKKKVTPCVNVVYQHRNQMNQIGRMTDDGA